MLCFRQHKLGAQDEVTGICFAFVFLLLLSCLHMSKPQIPNHDLIPSPLEPLEVENKVVVNHIIRL